MSLPSAYRVSDALLPPPPAILPQALPATESTYNAGWLASIQTTFGTTFAQGLYSDQQIYSAADAFKLAYAQPLVLQWGQIFELRIIQTQERFRRLADRISGKTNIIWQYRTIEPPSPLLPLDAGTTEEYYDLVPEFEIRAAAQRHAERLAAYSEQHPDQIDLDFEIDFDGADW